jgi:hypothetical protein
MHCYQIRHRFATYFYKKKIMTISVCEIRRFKSSFYFYSRWNVLVTIQILHISFEQDVQCKFMQHLIKKSYIFFLTQIAIGCVIYAHTTSNNAIIYIPFGKKYNQLVITTVNNDDFHNTLFIK